jgi:D-glycero-alpha-D-manno-heptose 1-phosphate guanylyltransferase
MSEHVVAEQRTNSWIAVVLAGGFGTRIRHLHPDLPKPMIPVAGRPFLEWIIRYLTGQGVRHILISTGYRGEIVERHFSGFRVENGWVRCVREPEPLGTAGGFLHAAGVVTSAPDAWLVLNGDTLVPAPLEPLAGALQEADVLGAILGVAVPDATRFGSLRLGEDGELVGFHEKRPGAGVINAGVYLFRPELVSVVPARRPLSFEADVFPGLIAARRRLKVCLTNAPFLDMGTPEGLASAEDFVRSTGLASISV